MGVGLHTLKGRKEGKKKEGGGTGHQVATYNVPVLNENQFLLPEALLLLLCCRWGGCMIVYDCMQQIIAPKL